MHACVKVGRSWAEKGQDWKGRAGATACYPCRACELLQAGSSSPPVVLTQCPFLFSLSLLELTSHLSESLFVVTGGALEPSTSLVQVLLGPSRLVNPT